MRLDEINRMLGIKTPAQAFKKCPRCKRAELWEFEGEVFCKRCSWDSVLIHAEVLGHVMAMAERRGRPRSVERAAVVIEAVAGATAAPNAHASVPYLSLFLPSESREVRPSSHRGRRPEVA